MFLKLRKQKLFLTNVLKTSEAKKMFLTNVQKSVVLYFLSYFHKLLSGWFY